MELKLIDKNGKAAKSGIEVSEATFGREFNEALVHQVVTAYMANARVATRAQKGRDTVSHTTHKPWNQKGTGRARSGMSSSPIWRGGGRAFPNSPDENFSHKVNRKMFRAGMAAILSQLVRDERLVVVDSFTVETPKTKEFVGLVKSMGIEQGLFITNEMDENLYLSSRNLPNVLVIETQQVDPYSLLRFKKIVITRDAVKQLEEQWA
ncbi:MAG TPA: 50S ribosomal protein L4 [Pseudogulbenkiania sp.]|nr:50S ribosomal protein L4 [Pseudogulbenkiania sp.]